MNLVRIKTQFIKEYWEFKNLLFWLPIFLLALIFLTPIGTIVYHGVDKFPSLEKIAQLATMADSPHIEKMFSGVASTILLPFMICALFIQLYYFLSCLYEERKDLSIYFWRSLPVSDLSVVLVKLAMGALVIPGIFMLAAMATIALFLVLLLLISIVLSVGYDISFWPAWANGHIISTLAYYPVSLLALSLWLLPVFAWLMLASMFAQKAPFLWACLPIVLLHIIEAILVNYGLMDTNFIAATLGHYFQLSESLVNENFHQNMNVSSSVLTLLLAKVNVVAVLLSAGLVYLTYVLRTKQT